MADQSADLSKKNTLILLIAIILLAAFVRLFHFHDWLFFKWDQAREAVVVSQAVEHGPGQLPLLGPRATRLPDNDYLRLGPAYYYVLYLSALISGSTDPVVFAYPEVFFSLLTIPLLFLLLRLYFSRLHSLVLTTLYAFSYLAIYHARFAWNPNSVPFFTVVNFLGLLKFVHETDRKKKMGWLSAWVLALAVASQYHYFAFFTLLGTDALFLSVHYRIWEIKRLWQTKAAIIKQGWTYVLAGLLFFSFIYTPVIINEYHTGFNNSKNFIAAFSSKPKKNPLFEKLKENVQQDLLNASLITTSVQPKKLPTYLFSYLIGLPLLAGGLLLSLRAIKKHPAGLRNDFVTLLPIWIGVFFIVCIPVAMQLRPRYFTPMFPLMFIFLGLIFLFIEEKLGRKKGLATVFVIAAAFLVMNVSNTAAWFVSQHKAQTSPAPKKKTFLLSNADGVTLGQYERIIDHMIAETPQGKPVIYWSDSDLMPPFDYLFARKTPLPQTFYLERVYSDIPFDTYYIVAYSSKGLESVKDEFKKDAQMVSSFQAGQLTAFQFRIDPEHSKRYLKTKKKKPASKAERVYWDDVVGDGNKAAEEDETEETMGDEEDE